MNANQRQSIPTLPDAQTPARIVALELMRLFDSVLSVKGNSSACLHEASTPGAADALRAWAGARGFAIEDSHHVGQYGNYASLCVEVDGSSICVLRYRDLTDEEIARATSAEAAGKVAP